MKKHLNLWIMIAIVAMMTCFTACEDDEDPEPEVMTTYTLNSVSDPAIDGEVTFTKLDASSTLVRIELMGTTAGNSHPAHIHANSASEGGGIVVHFTPVDGATGISETTVSALSDGTAISYEGLVGYDGHVNVHLSTTEMSTLIAQGNIGSNAP